MESGDIIFRLNFEKCRNANTKIINGWYNEHHKYSKSNHVPFSPKRGILFSWVSMPGDWQKLSSFQFGSDFRVHIKMGNVKMFNSLRIPCYW